jgi:carbamoyltransferase
MRGALLGPSYSNEEIERFLRKQEAPYVRLDDDDLVDRVAQALAAGKIIGWFQGRMEFGPRSLGGRSMIGDARSPEMQSAMNLKIKYRESFRPFAPSVLRERVADYFEMNADSPYMLLVAPVLEKRRTEMTKEQERLWGIELLKVPRSDIPAVTHIDYSARIQTVHEATHARYLCAAQGVRGENRVRRHREHVIQRPRRADRLHPRRRVPVLHAHRAGPARARELRPGKVPAKAARRRQRLAE